MLFVPLWATLMGRSDVGLYYYGTAQQSVFIYYLIATIVERQCRHEIGAIVTP